MPTRYQMNVPQHPDDNYSINKAFDRNYGNRLKSGDTTPLKYTIKDGDGEPLDKDRLMGMETTVKMKHEGVTAYEAEFEATLEEVSEGYEGDLVARYKIMEALPPSDTPYIVEFHFEEADDRFIFPSGNNLPLYITPSSLNSDGEAIKNASEQRLNEIVERKLEENPVLSEAEAKELARQENYQELLDTGVMQTKINERLEDLEEEYAPKLTEVTAQLAQRALNLLDFGAKGDGTTDDTQAIVDMFQYAETNNLRNVYVPPNVYRLNPIVRIRVPSNINLFFAPTATFKNLPHSVDGYALLSFWDVENINVFFGIMDGNKQENSATGGQHGHGFDVRGVRNVNFYNSKAINCWGDGMLIASSWEIEENEYCEDVVVDNFHSEGNRRQGISITSAKNVTINRPTIKNIGGTYPGDGIDIEPDKATEIIENLKIIDSYTENCFGSGIKFYISLYQTPEHPITVDIIRPVDKGSEHGLRFTTYIENIEGHIYVEKPKSYSPKSHGFFYDRWSSTSPRIDVFDPEAIDVPVNSFGHAVAELNTPPNDHIIGNVHIYRPRVLKTKNGAMPGKAFSLYKSGASSIDNVSIIDPQPFENMTRWNRLYIDTGDNSHIHIKDTHNIFTTTVTNSEAQMSTEGDYSNTFINEATNPSGVTLTSDSDFIGNELTFINRSDTQFAVYSGTFNLFPENDTGNLVSRKKGDRLKLKKEADGWYVVEKIGNWEEQ